MEGPVWFDDHFWVWPGRRVKLGWTSLLLRFKKSGSGVTLQNKDGKGCIGFAEAWNEPNPLQFGQTRRVLLSYSKHLRMSLFTNSYMGYVEFHLHEPMIFGSPPTILTHIFSGAMTPASCEEEAWGTGALARSHVEKKICIGLHIVSHTLW